jgi:hypothetical protein
MPQNDEFDICGGVLVSYKGNESLVELPDDIIGIGENAFKNNLILSKVIFSSTVTTVGKSAFAGCVNLLEIENYQNVQEFGEECFYGAGLLSVEISQNVRVLGKQCFANMPNLTTVTYAPNKNLKLNKTFANCKNLVQVDMDQCYIFPSMHRALEVQNNPSNTRPTYTDVFPGTPYINSVKTHLLDMFKKGICPECGGSIRKGLFHAKCQGCGIDLKN